jgi:DNA-binding MarR family transcriptional regulator
MTQPDLARQEAEPPRPETDDASQSFLELVELLFFAYRDFVGDPDRLLEDFGFGRAHHRVLHFVARNPGLTIAELLTILKITKQSLNPVLKELIGKGYIDSLPGREDRRQRHLYVSKLGKSLTQDLVTLQTRRMARATSECGPEAAKMARQFLAAMIEPSEREEALRIAAAGGMTR